MNEDPDEAGVDSGDFENFTNNRLMTPRMRKLTMNKDAREMLQDEINESVLRLKQAKFGHSLYDIVPDHQNQFYLPDRHKYMPKPSRDKRSTSQIGKDSKMSKHPTVVRSNTDMSRASMGLQQIQRVTGSAGMENGSMFMTEPPSSLINV